MPQHPLLSTAAFGALVLGQTFLAASVSAQDTNALNSLIQGGTPQTEEPVQVAPDPVPTTSPRPATEAPSSTPVQEKPFGLADAGAPSLIAPIRVSQAAISAEQVPFRSLMEIGRHLFTQSFTTQDGYGEGPTGPRELKRLQAGNSGPMSAFKHLPWMRVNGLDAQACLECHSVGGMDRVGAEVPLARSIRTDGLGGTGGVSASAIINPMQQTPAAPWVEAALLQNGYQDPNNMVAVFLRNPPHVFGAGYTQTLAEEMSFDLLSARYQALRAAVDNPGTAYRVELTAQGTDFGSYVVTVPHGYGEIDFAALEPCGENQGIDEVCSGIDGVGEDFVVRPFQWKGIASNMRNFVRDALNFHFAMMPMELAPGEADPDGDGVPNEVTVGEVTALTSFALAVRPPVQVVPEDPVEASKVARGFALFQGQGMPQGFGPEAACSSCHHVSKTLYDPIARIQDPRTQEAERFVALESTAPGPKLLVTGPGVGLGQSAPRGLTLPVEQYFFSGGNLAAQERAELGNREAKVLVDNYVHTPPAYEFNLSFLSGYEENPFPALLPRLPIADDDRVDVQLYSDLKRHNMGRCLADIILQQTDREGVFVPREEFLTRPLWGVADTGPWLHDGRALSLTEAIMMHSDRACDDDGSGYVSEANEAVDAFALMSDADQAAIIAFLSSLRLPREPVQ